jgi:5'-3' exonuclease
VSAAAGNGIREETVLWHRVFDAIVAYTNSIIEMVRPSKTYVAIDGVPPLAKMYQQRKRRYMAVKEAAFMGDRSRPGAWNSSVVTPGTTFMKALSEHLTVAFARDPNIVFSDWTTPGEGEHKIFGWLATSQTDRVPQGTSKRRVFIYGLDADMIMLSLLHPEHEIYLLREHDERHGNKQHGNGQGPPRGWNAFDFVSINALAATIGPQDAIADFVMLCALLGNDFVPPLSYMRILNNDVEQLLVLYDRVRDGARIVRVKRADGRDTHVDFGVLKKLFAALKDGEDAKMLAAFNAYHDRCPPAPPPRASPRDVLAHRWRHMPATTKAPRSMIDVSRPGWRVAYYHHLFPGPADVSGLVARYLDGLEWTMRYYLSNEDPRCEWCYEPSYSPTVLDVHNYMQVRGGPDGDLGGRYPALHRVTPLVQLLAVLPPAQERLVPHPYGTVMTDVDRRCVHMFPHDFSVSTFIKTLSWECHPELVPIDLGRIADAIDRVRAESIALGKNDEIN